jgi:uncharacterized protein YegL
MVSVTHYATERGDTMQPGLTELVFILDRSGSMAGLESDSIGGYNSYLESQKKVPGAARITTVLFDNQYELLHDRIDLRAVNPITAKDYYVRGNTALIDAIGRTIDKIVTAQRNTAEPYRAEKVMFVIITDGMENASRRYRLEQVRQMIEHEKEKYGWEFIFLGANIDAIETAGQFGINADRASNWMPDGVGTANNFDALSRSHAAYRMAPAAMAAVALQD